MYPIEVNEMEFLLFFKKRKTSPSRKDGGISAFCLQGPMVLNQFCFSHIGVIANKLQVLAMSCLNWV